MASVGSRVAAFPFLGIIFADAIARVWLGRSVRDVSLVGSLVGSFFAVLIDWLINLARRQGLLQAELPDSTEAEEQQAT